MLDVSKSFKKADQDLENIRFYSLGWPTEKQSTLAGLPTSRCMKKAPFTIVYEMNEHKNHVGCLSKSFKKADQDLENIRFYSLGWPTEKQSTLAEWHVGCLKVLQKSRSGPRKYPFL